jgi:hypothetical protein
VRTVFIFPRLGREEIVRRLDDLAGPASLDQWILDDALWIRLVDVAGGLYADWDDKLRGALAHAEGGTEPGWAVIADVSSHVPGDAIVRRLVDTLTDGDGHVIDDHGGSIWTASQVLTREVAYGWPGFSRTEI